MARGTPGQKTMVQDAIDRWWWPTLMMFGPHDLDSKNTPELVRWRIKTKSNDELRQDFVNELVPELRSLGLSVPDPQLSYDSESGNWMTGEINWEEFWQVVKGQGPCNAERLQTRREAHDEGRWVREAVEAYAKRNAQVAGR
jgi:ring-1,2-phenylacetyl-CoA epoxidase subunit PaaA